MNIFTAAFLNVLKNLPLWLMVGLAIAIDIYWLLPLSNYGISAEAKSWSILPTIIFNILAIFKIVNDITLFLINLNQHKQSKRTFYLSPDSEQCFCSTTKQQDDSIVTQLSAAFIVKNCSNEPVSLISVQVKKPCVRGKVLQSIILTRSVNKNIYDSAKVSGYSIPVGYTLPGQIIILIQGDIGKKFNKILKSVLIIADSDGNKRKVVVPFIWIKQPKVQEKNTTIEALFAISNPLEKNIVSVLQSELARYNKCGRRVGGLGSIQVIFQGRTMVGVGTECWEANSPKNQSIINNPKEAILQSDNLTALLGLYSKLESDIEQKQFVDILINRLDGKREYLAISYFIVCILWKIGYLHDALHKAKVSLPQNEIKVFGLSNILMILNGLLRYFYNDFTDKMLDDIEEFISGINEHTFSIAEKIASIRTIRLHS